MDSITAFQTGLTDTVFELESAQRLIWLPEVGMGRLALHDATTYDAAYWANYRKLADTSMGCALTEARVQMVHRHYSGSVLDVGIGSGQFLMARKEPTFGFDVNPHAVAWLKEYGLYADLYGQSFRALTFWDALEHIPDPGAAVAQAGEWVFVSLPIFDGPEHCLQSRHYKPGEHLWYFEDRGIRWWFERQGFECIESNTIETDLGRDGIGSYAFRRVE